MIGFIGIATTYIFGTLLTANGSLKQLNIMAFSGMILNVVLNLILIPRLQAYGSAYASLATQLFTGATQLILALVIFRLKPGFTFIIQLFAFTGVTIVLAVLTKNMDNWIYGYFTMIAGSVLFAFIIRLISIRDMLKIILYKST